MKKLGKALLGLLAAVAMLVTGLVAPTTAFAVSDGVKHTITISNEAEGHTYEAYQVFTGKLSDDKNTLSNIEWGQGVDATGLLAALKPTGEALKSFPAALQSNNESIFKDATTAQDVADKLSATSQTDDDAVAKAFAAIVSEHLSNTVAGTSGTQTNGKYTITVTGTGYYFIKDKDSTNPKDDTVTQYILKITDDTEVTAKSGAPTVEKKVHDLNDSATDNKTDDTQDDYWSDSADHDINDDVEYKLTGTLPDAYSRYDRYYYAFTDTLSAGLTIQDGTQENGTETSVNTIQVFAVDTTGTSTEIKALAAGATDDGTGYTTTVTAPDSTLKTPYTGGSTLKIAFKDLKKIVSTDNTAINVAAGWKIVVRYKARLNSDAVVGAKGNPNKVDLTYSNNPNNTGDGETGKTPEDTVIVFTYEAVFNKTNPQNQTLNGATFTLYKKTKPTATNEDDKWSSLGQQVGTTSSKFTWSGLDDGDYKLVEDKEPDGYNKLTKPIYFTITGNHVTNWDGTYNGDIPGAWAAPTAAMTQGVESGANITITASAEDHNPLTADIVNKKGSSLPETGGMGTVILYALGGAFVVAAGLWFGLRRRFSNR